MMPEEFLQLKQHTVPMPPPEAYDAVNDLLREKRQGNIAQIKQSELLQHIMQKCSVTEVTAFTWLHRVILGAYQRRGWEISKIHFCKNKTEDTCNYNQLGYIFDAKDAASNE